MVLLVVYRTTTRLYGYLPKSTVDPRGSLSTHLTHTFRILIISAVRIHAMRVGVAAIFVVTSIEILIGLERVASAANPQKYHDESAIAKQKIISLLAMTLVAATLIAAIASTQADSKGESPTNPAEKNMAALSRVTMLLK